MNLLKTILLGVFAIAIVVLVYFLYDTLFSPYYFSQEKAERYEIVKQRMRDIIEAQEAYKKIHGEYAPEFDKLISTIKNDSIRVVRTIGSESDTVKSISVAEAMEIFEIKPSQSDSVIFEKIENRLQKYNEQLRRTGGDAITNYVVRDTTYVPVMSTINIHTTPDSLKYIPYSEGETFSLETNIIYVGAGRVKVPTFEVVAYNNAILKNQPRKYYKPKEGIRLGSTTEATLDIVDIRIRKDKQE